MSSKNEKKIQDLGDEQESQEIQLKALSPLDKLHFAKWVLKGIFIFFMLSIGVWLYQKNCGETLLEIGRTGLLPIVSFVIGDYFGSQGR